MKKSFLYTLIICAIFTIGMYIGYKLYTGDEQEQAPTTYSTKEEQNALKPDPITSVSFAEEKISPNANFILKKHYTECDHITKEFVELPQELVNLSKKELQEQYSEWTIETFSTHEVVLLKEQVGYCNEHFVLRPDNGHISIYSVLENGEEIKSETTDISTIYLPETDMLRINEGIKVYGKEELNSVLEDFE